MLKKIGIVILNVCLWGMAIAATRAPVAGFARSFLMNTPISHAQIQVLETGQTFYTDKEGKFGPFLYTVGKTLTLEFRKWGYKTTQSGTFVVPKEGLTGPYHNISFQIPSLETFYLMQALIGANLHKDACHVVTTVTAYHKILNDCPQGEANATLVLTPAIQQPVFYFGIFEQGPAFLKCKTNPLSKKLAWTTLDGGAGFFNLPPREELYTLSAKKAGVSFSEAKFLCRKGAFINISPPQGPMVRG